MTNKERENAGGYQPTENVQEESLPPSGGSAVENPTLEMLEQLVSDLGQVLEEMRHKQAEPEHLGLSAFADGGPCCEACKQIHEELMKRKKAKDAAWMNQLKERRVEDGEDARDENRR